MKVLALLGSPRKGGNTEVLAGEFLRGAADAGADCDKVHLDDFRIRPLGLVGDLPGKRVDTRAGDDFLKVFKRFMAADVICYVSPVYVQGMTAQMKCFVDRFSAYKWRSSYRAQVAAKGYAVITAFGAEGEGRWVIAPIKAAIGNANGKYLGDLGAQVYKKGEAKKDPKVLKAAYALGARAVRKMRARRSAQSQ